jgi:flagellar biogenesis protein FliO
MTRLAATISISLSAWLLAVQAAPAFAEEAKVRAGQTLADLLGQKEPSAAASRALPSGGEIASKLGLWSGGLVVLVAATVLYRRRRKLIASSRPEGEGVEVVGRVHLSHRHAVFVLRVAGRKLVVGVSGDHMTALGSLDVPASAELPIKAVPSTSSEERSTGARGFTVRPGDMEAISAARGIPDADLMPYRKQMDRLRGLLRGLRGDQEDGDSPPEAQRP